MIYEVIDKNSGAILFKKDKESRTIDQLLASVEALQKQNSDLLARIKKLEKKA